MDLHIEGASPTDEERAAVHARCVFDEAIDAPYPDGLPVSAMRAMASG